MATKKQAVQAVEQKQEPQAQETRMKAKRSFVVQKQDKEKDGAWSDMNIEVKSHDAGVKALKKLAIEGNIEPGNFRIARIGPTMKLAVHTQIKAVLEG